MWLALVTQIIGLVPTLLGSFERFITERDEAQGESEGESLREALVMTAETKQQFAETLAKARAKLGASARLAAKPLAVAGAPPLRAQVRQLIELLQQVEAGLPPEA